MAALGEDYAPLADVRAGSAYRLSVAKNLLHRFWLETRPDQGEAPPPVKQRSEAFRRVLRLLSSLPESSLRKIITDGSHAIDQGVGVRAISGEKTGFAYSDEINADALLAARKP